MGADSARRFYAGGRPRVSGAPLPECVDVCALTKSQRKNAQRDRRRAELRSREDHELEAACDAVRVSESSRVDHIGEESASEPAENLARVCCRHDARACVRYGALPLLVGVLRLHSRDASVAALCFKAIAHLCAGAAAQQDEAIESGILHIYLTCLELHIEVVSVVAACCHALCHLATGLGAAARRDAAASAGMLDVLVLIAERWKSDEATNAAALAALRSLTRDSARLQEHARMAGAEARWLV